MGRNPDIAVRLRNNDKKGWREPPFLRIEALWLPLCQSASDMLAGGNKLERNDLTKFIYLHKYCVFGKNCVTLQHKNRIMMSHHSLRFLSLIVCIACGQYLSFFSTPAIAANLKQSVVLVEPEFEEMRSFFSEYALPLSRLGFRGESRALMAYNRGISGSGFVVQRGDSLVLLTNRHVVGPTRQVSVTMQNGKQTTTFRHCPVVAVSPLTDMAMIALPDSSGLEPIPLSDTPMQDADEVWAAGFPALGDDPSWQITQGTVSNSELYREELLGRQQAAIQHTAPLDAGSSGGPLLRKNEAGDYSVVGINTWKAGYRDGVGIAIPLSAIRHFLLYGNEQEPKSDDERTEEWNRLIREDYVLASEALSADYLITRSAEDWAVVLEAMGYTNQQALLEIDRTEALDILRLVWAFDAMRFALAGGEKAHFDITWGDVQGQRKIVAITYPELTKKQYFEATKRIRK